MIQQSITVKTGSWCGDRSVVLTFPAHWEIKTHEGSMLPGLDRSQMEALLQKPVDDFHLGSILGPENKVVIVVDDHTRPTPVADILHPLIGILKTSGIPNKNIKIIIAIGTHILDKKSFMRNKLGRIMDGDIEIVFPDCRDNRQLVLIGQSDTGIPVYVNRHFAEADIKIAISGVYPHDEGGFSGGAKILIGVLGLETISRFHRRHGLMVRGSSVDTPFRKELEHFADIARLDYSINCVVNGKKEIVDLHCGDFRKSFRAAVKTALKCFGTKVEPTADVIISNAYPLDTALSVLGKSTWPFAYSKLNAEKIILTALCDCSAHRIALAETRKELLLQKIKKNTGATFAKKCFKDLLCWLRFVIRPEDQWNRNYLVHVVRRDHNAKFRPKIINGCGVDYDWQNIIYQLLRIHGHEKPVKVSLFLYAPLLFPMFNEDAGLPGSGPAECREKTAIICKN